MSDGRSCGDGFEDAFETGFGQQVERRLPDLQTLTTRLDLMLRFLTRAVQDRADVPRDVCRCLQQQRGLADAGFAAKKHERPGHDATAKHAIELTDASRDPFGRGDLDVRVAVWHPSCLTARIWRVAAASDAAARSSTYEFHAPQSAQRPSHFCACAPHS